MNITQFILDNLSNNVAKLTAEAFGISRQAVNARLKRLEVEGLITSCGSTRNKTYLPAKTLWERSFTNITSLAEDVIWRKEISPLLQHLPENVLNLWNACFTEMLNNAIDHSEGSEVAVKVITSAAETEITISDNGVGVFKKIQEKFDLLDERHAILELSKGKLTTAPDKHSGEGIFFTSRLADDFKLASGNSCFSHSDRAELDWLIDREQAIQGTSVIIKIKNDTPRVAKDVYDAYAAPGEDYVFSKTVVPVRLAQYGKELLVSRSQAKRVLARVENFKIVLLDFSGVTEIGQAFADEIFRVFSNSHPDVRIIEANTIETVAQMIQHVKKPA